MLWVCVVDEMDVVISVCIVRRGAVDTGVWVGRVFCHAYVVCLCIVCIMWQLSMPPSA